MVGVIRASSIFLRIALLVGYLCLPESISFASPQQIYQLVPITEIPADICDSCGQKQIATFVQSAPPAQEFLAAQQLRWELSWLYTADIWRTFRYMGLLAQKRSMAKRTVHQNIYQKLNALYVKTDPEERDKMRLVWTETLGFDLWYPYFKTKEIEAWVKERISFKIFKMKCKPQNKKGSFFYVCKKSF